nr:MAG TPA: hypothetical protein [Caudoviricetes sp.]
MKNVNCLRCRFRHEDNGNCTAVGGFCTAVPAAHCPLLREYLDTRLTPQEVISMHGEWRAMMSVLNSIGGGYTRLRELAEADKDGRLVVLPCKVGDTVYRIFNPLSCEPVISAHTLMSVDYIVRWIDKFGKTVFLTREEAEKALGEAMKDD